VKRRYDLVTFDCYGTLIDWEGGISAAFREAARADGVRLGRDDILAAHAEIEPQVQSQTFREYREVLVATAQRMADRLGWSLTRERASFLARSLPAWRPFDDTNPALERLSASGYQLGILSNIDNDLLQGTLRHLTVRFDLLVTAEQVRSYKPAHGHFEQARGRAAGLRWVHAAQSYFHDVEPAVALHLPVVWVNRNNDKATGSARPDREVSTLKELADWLVPRPEAG
jgi:2-haloacid dehalogenase/putative hydrolase of the HAD superfamily